MHNEVHDVREVLVEVQKAMVLGSDGDQQILDRRRIRSRIPKFFDFETDPGNRLPYEIVWCAHHDVRVSAKTGRQEKEAECSDVRVVESLDSRTLDPHQPRATRTTTISCKIYRRLITLPVGVPAGAFMVIQVQY